MDSTIILGAYPITQKDRKVLDVLSALRRDFWLLVQAECCKNCDMCKHVTPEHSNCGREDS